ncbi:MAG: 30S ribosomal protein S6 [Bdellovibrionales bacterium]|nr:30S ribosomal protein S6 [Bdellovibrionales bacterium]
MQLEKRPYVRPYEAVILMNPDSTEEDQKNLFKRNKAIIEEQFGGEVKHLDTWGRRSLANTIGKNKKAVFFHTTFTAEPSAILELERTMRINDNVLRFVHTVLDDRTDLSKYLENFKTSLAESAAREREREAKFQARKAAGRGPRRDDERGGRRDEFGGRGDDDGGDVDLDSEDEA